MGHDHTHSHGDDHNPYYLDQLCLVALSAAFGCICLALYFWRQDILGLMLGNQFHLFILISGIALVLIALIRGAVLWIQVGSCEPHHDHGHEHLPAAGHDHDHQHEGCSDCHEPGHEHGVETHVHHHHKDPGLVHLHSHTHGGHDHSWAPWRYVVLLIPVILFLIGLPNKGPQVQASNVGDLGGDTHQIELPTFLAMGPPSLDQLAMTALLRPYFPSKARLIEFTTLEGCARTLELQQAYKGSVVSVKGQFVPDKGGNPRVFSLGRFRINCCAADAIQLNVPIVAKEPIQQIKPNDWILVTGEIDFFSRGPEVRSILRVHSRADIVKTTPESDPYVKSDGRGF